jgi:uncharacterized phage-associated protein
MEYGPEYPRLAQALERWGVEPVTSEIVLEHHLPNGTGSGEMSTRAILLPEEQEILAKIYRLYGHLQTAQLATLTRGNGTPWETVFAAGSGKLRDISHVLIKSQFEEIAAEAAR